MFNLERIIITEKKSKLATNVDGQIFLNHVQTMNEQMLNQTVWSSESSYRILPIRTLSCIILTTSAKLFTGNTWKPEQNVP